MADSINETHKVKLADGNEYELNYLTGSLEWLKDTHSINLMEMMSRRIPRNATEEQQQAEGIRRMVEMRSVLVPVVMAGVMDADNEKPAIAKKLVLGLKPVDLQPIILQVFKAAFRDLHGASITPDVKDVKDPNPPTE